MKYNFFFKFEFTFQVLGQVVNWVRNLAQLGFEKIKKVNRCGLHLYLQRMIFYFLLKPKKK